MIEFIFNEPPWAENAGSLDIIDAKFEQISKVPDVDAVTDDLNILSAKMDFLVQNDSLDYDALTDSLDIISASLRYSVITLNPNDADSVTDTLDIIASKYDIVAGIVGVDSVTDSLSIIDGELTWA